MASEEVVNGSVFAVCNNRFNFGSCRSLMLFKERQHQMGFVDITGRSIGCGYDFILAVNGPMDLVRKLRFAPVYYRGVRIGA